MKSKNKLDLKNKTTAELGNLAESLQSQIRFAVLELTTRKNKNTNIVKNLRRDFAQILTAKKEKELYANT